MTPSIPKPPFDLPPAKRDETAPRSVPIRGEMCPAMKRFLRGAAYVGQYRYQTKTAPISDVTAVAEAYSGRSRIHAERGGLLPPIAAQVFPDDAR